MGDPGSRAVMEVHMRPVHTAVVGLLAGVLALSTGNAQTVRWNDRVDSSQSLPVPYVRVEIDGPHFFVRGTPVPVRFQASDDAFVVVGRVDDQGRLTILFPSRSHQRIAVPQGDWRYIRDTRLGPDASFISTETVRGGYVFAVASHFPPDLSMFENRDFDGFGFHSRYSLASHSASLRPDVWIERFAATILGDAPYDYDIDYYSAVNSWRNFYAYGSAYDLCSSMSRAGFGLRYPAAYSLYDWNMWDWWGAGFSPWHGVCGSWYNSLRCLSFSALYGGCNGGYRPIVPPQTVPAVPVDLLNDAVVRGGMATPTPLPVGTAGGDDVPPMERRAPGFDSAIRTPAARSEWDSFLSIPERAARKLKESAPDGVDRDRLDRDRAPGFDGAVMPTRSPKDRKAGVASSDMPPSRVQPERQNTTVRDDTPRRTGRPSFDNPKGPSPMGGIRRPVGASARDGSRRPQRRPTLAQPTSGSSKVKKPPPSTSPKSKPPADD